MRFSDWSSDVCSSDLLRPDQPAAIARHCWRGDAAEQCQIVRRQRSRFNSSASHRGDCDHTKDARRQTRDLTGCLLALLAVQTTKTHRTAPVFQTGANHLSRSLAASRSEEHTSELQSLMRISYAVFCLKKKKNHTRLNK